MNMIHHTVLSYSLLYYFVIVLKDGKLNEAVDILLSLEKQTRAVSSLLYRGKISLIYFSDYNCNCGLVIPKTNQKIGDRSFSVAAPCAWNRLLADLKLLRSTASYNQEQTEQFSVSFMLLTSGTLCEL